jgi:hypothetical protein
VPVSLRAVAQSAAGQLNRAGYPMNQKELYCAIRDLAAAEKPDPPRNYFNSFACQVQSSRQMPSEI